jgi:hypothetical protein
MRALRRHMTMASDLAGVPRKAVTWSCGLLLSRPFLFWQPAAKDGWGATLRAIPSQFEPDPFG